MRAGDGGGEGLGHWVERPVRYPGRCLLTGTSDRASGPYWEGPQVMHVMVVGGHGGGVPKRGPIYLSRQALREIAGHHASPWQVLAPAAVRELSESVAHGQRASARVLELEVEVAELRRRVDEAPPPAASAEQVRQIVAAAFAEDAPAPAAPTNRRK